MTPPIFGRSRDPEERAARRNDRWLASLDGEVRAAGGAVVSALPVGWQVGGIDRERFASSAVTYGATAFGPGGPGGPVLCGVATTQLGALEALAARLAGGLTPADLWAPPVAALDEARRVGSVGALEAAGWRVTTDGEKYGLVHDPIAVTGVVVERDPDTWVMAAATGRGRHDDAVAALDAVLAGRLDPTDRWAPV